MKEDRLIKARKLKDGDIEFNDISISDSEYHMKASFEEHEFFNNLKIDKWYEFIIKLDIVSDPEHELYPGTYYFRKVDEGKCTSQSCNSLRDY